MRLSAALVVLSQSLPFIPFATAYVWPSPQLDALEQLRYDQFGYNAAGAMVGGLVPCTLAFSSDQTPGRSNAADWIRNAYHDMSTHNVTDGTGGLDASIRFEQDRPENAGNQFSDTSVFLAINAGRYVSVADSFALGAIFAYEQCGLGVRIAFRGGRVDATGPNAPGVPQPQDALESHTAAFARMGFTATEMIQLVACGHSFGGVQHQFFPTIVPPSANDTAADFDATFDSTPFHFDNNVATEYIEGTTANPLVVGANVSTRSDMRIFSSDKNATMRAFAQSPQLFAQTCAALLARMVDTVPNGVKLTEVINPLPVKPQSVQVVYMQDGTLILEGQVRFWDMPENSNRTITLIWEGRNGQTCTSCRFALGHTIDQVSSSNAGETHTALWYDFNRTTEYPRLNSSSGISKFWFEIQEPGKPLVVSNQDGAGFTVQDTLLLGKASCFSFDFQNGVQIANLTLAVLKGSKVSQATLEVDRFDPNTSNPVVHTFNLTLTPMAADNNSSHDLFSTQAMVPLGSSGTSGGMNVAAIIGDTTFRSPFVNVGPHSLPSCN